MKRHGVRSAVLALLIAAAAPAMAQTYPAGPVKLVVPAAAGASIDVIARLVAEQLARTWGQQVLILNHPGGGTGIGARAAATAAPDGSTLFFGLSSTFVALPVLQPNLGFDVGRDFAHRLCRRAADGGRSQPVARRELAGRPHRAGEAAGWRAQLRRDPERRPRAPERRAAAAPCRNRPHVRPLSGNRAGRERYRRRPRADARRILARPPRCDCRAAAQAAG